MYVKFTGLGQVFSAPFDVELESMRIFPVTNVIYIEVGAGASQLHYLHDSINRGALEFEEPFSRFRAHGLLVLHGAKISKSRGGGAYGCGSEFYGLVGAGERRADDQHVLRGDEPSDFRRRSELVLRFQPARRFGRP